MYFSLLFEYTPTLVSLSKKQWQQEKFFKKKKITSVYFFIKKSELNSGQKIAQFETNRSKAVLTAIAAVEKIEIARVVSNVHRFFPIIFIVAL